jgi:HEAT repeat protein
VIRATAVSALGSLGGKAEIPLLQAKLDDASFWVSLEAARGLLALGDIATLERLAASDGPWAMLAQQVLTE